MNARHVVFAVALAGLPLLASAQATTAPAAHVALVTGSVTVGTGPDAKSLKAGDAVFERQTVNVGPNSYANLKFADGGRVLLRPNTEFVVEAYRFSGTPETPRTATSPSASQAAPGNAFFKLLRGGFRAISGAIGRADRQAYRVTTPAATIGIRGTDYEVQLCSDDCPSVPSRATLGGTEVASTELSGLQLAQAGGGGGTGGGVIVATHEGSISLRTSRGEFSVDAGQVALALANGQTFMLRAVPDALLLNPTPPPQDCE